MIWGWNDEILSLPFLKELSCKKSKFIGDGDVGGCRHCNGFSKCYIVGHQLNL